MHDIEDAVGQPAASNEKLVECCAANGGVFSGLPDDGVSGQQCGHDIPRRYRDREVAGGDHRDCSDRTPESEQLLVRHLAGHCLPIEPPALTEEEVAGVDDLAHLAERLGVRLADLCGDQSRQRLGVVLDQSADVGDGTTPDRRRYGGPRFLGLLC